MNGQTRAVIVMALKADADITTAHREAVLLTLDTWTEAAPAPDPEPMLSPTDAAARLNITRRTLFRRIEAGTLNPVRYTSRKIALRLSEITAYAQAGAAGTAPATGTRPPRKQTRKERPPAAAPARSETPDRLAAAMKHARKITGRKAGKQT